jgi:hypothetical protein
MPAYISEYVRVREGSTSYNALHHYLAVDDERRGLVYDVGTYRIVDATTTAFAALMERENRAPPTRREVYLYRSCSRCSIRYPSGLCGPVSISSLMFVDPTTGLEVRATCKHITWPYCICPGALPP